MTRVCDINTIRVQDICQYNEHVILKHVSTRTLGFYVYILVRGVFVSEPFDFIFIGNISVDINHHIFLTLIRLQAMALIIQSQLHHISCYDPITQSRYLLPTPIRTSLTLVKKLL